MQFKSIAMRKTILTAIAFCLVERLAMINITQIIILI